MNNETTIVMNRHQFTSGVVAEKVRRKHDGAIGTIIYGAPKADKTRSLDQIPFMEASEGDKAFWSLVKKIWALENKKAAA